MNLVEQMRARPLRDLEKKGRALEKAGINREVLNALAEMGDYDDPC